MGWDVYQEHIVCTYTFRCRDIQSWISRCLNDRIFKLEYRNIQLRILGYLNLNIRITLFKIYLCTQSHKKYEFWLCTNMIYLYWQILILSQRNPPEAEIHGSVEICLRQRKVPSPGRGLTMTTFSPSLASLAGSRRKLFSGFGSLPLSAELWVFFILQTFSDTLSFQVVVTSAFSVHEPSYDGFYCSDISICGTGQGNISDPSGNLTNSSSPHFPAPFILMAKKPDISR